MLCWRMLTYADVCWRMLTYADVCWRMLTYACSNGHSGRRRAIAPIQHLLRCWILRFTLRPRLDCEKERTKKRTKKKCDSSPSVWQHIYSRMRTRICTPTRCGLTQWTRWEHLHIVWGHTYTHLFRFWLRPERAAGWVWEHLHKVWGHTYKHLIRCEQKNYKDTHIHTYSDCGLDQNAQQA
jgi:hypothetical protein